MTAKLTRNQVAWRIAQDIPDGAYVNIGIGQPELVGNYLPAGREIVLHSENGILGMGPEPPPEAADYELINAGKKPVTMLPGGSFFHHADSFAIVRGGHLDICVLGAFQVGANGDLANWSTGAPDAIPAVGGAMDIAMGSKRVFAMTDHVTRSGEPKIVECCTYPLTAAGVVDVIYSDLAVIDVTADGLVVREIVPGLDLATLQGKTGARLRLANDWRALSVPDL
jgi:3-oxoadipate CoA-transferase beta subunit